MTIVGNRPFSAESLASGADWESIRDAFFRSGDPDPILAWRTEQVDALVIGGHRDFLSNTEEPLAVLAVGGYGRRQLFPYSDIDLLLLFEKDSAAQNSKNLVSPFLQGLWDSGLRVSQSMRTVRECSEFHADNVELNISLLDPRYLAGDTRLSGQVFERMPKFIQSQRDALAGGLARLTRERHAKFGNTFYHLEPNVKESPGALRDYQVVTWLSRVRGGDAAENLKRLDDARRFLFAARSFAHCKNGRDDNVISFDLQEWIAAQIGLQPAEWMRRYYRHARDVHRAAMHLIEESEAQSSSLFSQFRDWRSRLSNADFSVLRERVHLRVPGQLAQDPDLMMRLFEFCARHGIRLAADTERRIADARPVLAEHYSQQRPTWFALKQILALPHALLALRAMHDTGALRILFPELEEIECLVIRDFYHRYTVDEHTLVTIQTLFDLRTPGGASKRPFAELLSECESAGVVAFALLFHDAGKGSPDEGHVDASVRLVEAPMERIEMPEADRGLVRFLIGAHLELSSTLNSRDLDDASTIENVAHRIGTVERLRALTLLTYCDISAVNPTAMTPWRAAQLFRLYRLTYNELTRELDRERIAPRPQDSAEKARFLAGFPTRYLRTHTEAEIEAHFAMAQQLDKAVVVTHVEKIESAYRLTVLTGDRPFLFSSIAGTLSSFGMNILKAEAFSNARGLILDTFVFADPLRTLELNPDEVGRLRSAVERVVMGKADVMQLLKNRPKPTLPSQSAGIDPAISFDSEASVTATLIQITAEDRPGLLYDLTRTMSAEGCSIEVVLIDTEAHKALDVFYVTLAGGKVPGPLQPKLRESLLEVCRG